jgi:copper chaperone CopZ
MSGVTNQNTTIAVGSTFDIYLDVNGNLAMLTGVDACEQDCQSAMQTMLREMPLDYTNGVPYFDTVFRQVNLNGFVSAGRQQLLNVPGVTEVKSFTASIANNVLTYSAQIATVYSPNAITVTADVAITS